MVKRDNNGFHQIVTLFQAVSLFDTITIEEAQENKVYIDHEDLKDKPNIVHKVVEHLQSQYDLKEKIKIQIKKNIPIGAGLAGGSTDAAAVLYGLNRLFNLNLSLDELITIAQKIGKDVPFFFKGGSQFGRHYGEELEQVLINDEYYIVIIYPGFEISTKESYQALKECDFNKGIDNYKNILSAIEKRDMNQMLNNLYNIFEYNALPKYTILSQIREDLLSSGMSAVLMSGTGSTVYGIVKDKKIAQKTNKKLKQKYKNVILSKPFYNGLFNL